MRTIGLIFFVLNTGLASAADRPNIVFILADDLGYTDLSCYGSKDIRTPNIDRIAKEGVRLTDCYAAAPVCSPTRAALITGRYPQRSGFEWVIRYTERDRGLPASESGLAKWLHTAGYRTALLGKWHLGYQSEFCPSAHGFDRFFGFPGADLDYYSHKDSLGSPSLYEQDKLIEQPGYLTDLITERAERLIGEFRGSPFYIEVAYNAPHWPFQRPDMPKDARSANNYEPETGTRADYVAIVERMDADVGKILAALERHGLSNNTLVIFTNDNGGERLSDNGPLFHGKYTLWEGGIRVPAVAKWPGRIPANTTSAQAMITMDWTASMLAAAGAKADRPLDGEDVLPILAGQQQPRERTLFWRLPRPDSKFGMKAVRRGKWKLVDDREMELIFDLAADPGERHNLAWREPKKVQDLRAALADWEKGLPKVK